VLEDNDMEIPEIGEVTATNAKIPRAACFFFQQKIKTICLSEKCDLFVRRVQALS